MLTNERVPSSVPLLALVMAHVLATLGPCSLSRPPPPVNVTGKAGKPATTNVSAAAPPLTARFSMLLKLSTAPLTVSAAAPRLNVFAAVRPLTISLSVPAPPSTVTGPVRFVKRDRIVAVAALNGHGLVQIADRDRVVSLLSQDADLLDRRQQNRLADHVACSTSLAVSPWPRSPSEPAAIVSAALVPPTIRCRSGRRRALDSARRQLSPWPGPRPGWLARSPRCL